MTNASELPSELHGRTYAYISSRLCRVARVKGIRERMTKHVCALTRVVPRETKSLVPSEFAKDEGLFCVNQEKIINTYDGGSFT